MAKIGRKTVRTAALLSDSSRHVMFKRLAESRTAFIFDKERDMPDILRNPLLTVDIIIEINNGIILIERKNPPHGWALPGGFVDYGESLETAAKREALEETSLDVVLKTPFLCYSDPKRDPRHHTVTAVFIATAQGTPHAADDAKHLICCDIDNLPAPIVFDHADILNDYKRFQYGESLQSIFLSHRSSSKGE